MSVALTDWTFSLAKINSLSFSGHPRQEGSVSCMASTSTSTGHPTTDFLSMSLTLPLSIANCCPSLFQSYSIQHSPYQQFSTMRIFLFFAIFQAAIGSPIGDASYTGSAADKLPRSEANGIPMDTSYPTLNITMVQTGNTNVTVTMANNEDQDILISSWYSILYPGTEAKGLRLFDGDQLVGNGPSQQAPPIFPTPTLGNFTQIAQGSNLSKVFDLTQIFDVTHSGNYTVRNLHCFKSKS